MKPSDELYVGLDIGGTKFLVGSAEGSGEIIERVRRPTPAGLDEGIEALNSMISDVARGKKIKAMGAAIGGPLDFRTGVVSPLHQPAWRNVPLARIMEERWGCPVRIDVDTNVAALAEYHFGSVKVPRLLYLTLSTGMGGGFLIDGRIYRGMDGAHPEAGHQSVNFKCSHPERVMCECGAPDCLEALVSGNGIMRIYGKPAESLGEDEWEEVSYNLGLGLRNLAVLFAPDVIVLGGGIATGRGERLVTDSKAVMRSRLKLVPSPEVRLSGLGPDTALMGGIAAAVYGLE